MPSAGRRPPPAALLLLLLAASTTSALKLETNHTLPLSPTEPSTLAHAQPGRTPTGHTSKIAAATHSSSSSSHHSAVANSNAAAKAVGNGAAAALEPAGHEGGVRRQTRRIEMIVRRVMRGDGQLRRVMESLRVMLVKYRLTAFTSEIGESLRPMVARAWVRASYAISWAYVTLDVIVCGFEAHMRKPKAAPVALSVFRAALFQAVATMLLPATFIHNVVHSAETALLNAGFGKRTELPRYTPLNFPLRTFRYPRQLGPPRLEGIFSWLPTAAGILCIPLVPFLFDHPIEAILDRVFREDHAEETPDDELLSTSEGVSSTHQASMATTSSMVSDALTPAHSVSFEKSHTAADLADDGITVDDDTTRSERSTSQTRAGAILGSDSALAAAAAAAAAAEAATKVASAAAEAAAVELRALAAAAGHAIVDAPADAEVDMPRSDNLLHSEQSVGGWDAMAAAARAMKEAESLAEVAATVS